MLRTLVFSVGCTVWDRSGVVRRLVGTRYQIYQVSVLCISGSVYRVVLISMTKQSFPQTQIKPRQNFLKPPY